MDIFLWPLLLVFMLFGVSSATLRLGLEERGPHGWFFTLASALCMALALRILF